MDETAVSDYITGTFTGVETVSANGDTFFFYDPTKMMPFATLVRSNFNDTASDLDRPGVYRLNIGVSKATFVGHFGERPPLPDDADAPTSSPHDFTALDTLLPHPVYGRMYWVCILNPSDATFDETVRPLLAEAYEAAVRKQDRRAARG